MSTKLFKLILYKNILCDIAYYMGEYKNDKFHRLLSGVLLWISRERKVEMKIDYSWMCSIGIDYMTNIGIPIFEGNAATDLIKV